MPKLRIAIIDLVARGPNNSLFARFMHAILASIMPQMVAAWCQKAGHDVQYICYTGSERLTSLEDDFDLVFLSSFTEGAQAAYALSNFYRARGAVTALGGPHARCYPEDAQKYFDYVLGFTDEALLNDVLQDCQQHRPEGVYLSAKQQPTTFPGVRERWPFVAATLKKAPWIKIVPMIASFGCPYTCSFCIDAKIPYQPLDRDVLKEDLRFLMTKYKMPIVAWHDPNFGIRFDETMNAIEEVVPPGKIAFIAESSLSLLSEPHLKRLQHNGFRAALPGIESWYDLGNKSKTGAKQGMDKVLQVSEHVNMVLRYVPYVQTNFVLGLDCDEGREPFELTKEFLKRTPGAFPGYSLLTAFGQASELNLSYQREERVLPFPFHFLNNNQAMNVRPKNYKWTELYDNIIDLVRFSFSVKMVAKRFWSNRGWIVRLMNLVRGVSQEGWGRLKYHSHIRQRLENDVAFQRYFNQESEELPIFYTRLIKKELGSLWRWLPEGALHHNAYAYAQAVNEREFSEQQSTPQSVLVS